MVTADGTAGPTGHVGFVAAAGRYHLFVALNCPWAHRTMILRHGSRYLCGNQATLADWRLFPTLVRFDVAYYGAFKCNLRRISDYPRLSAYTRDLYQTPGVAETVKLEIYKRGYFSPSAARNPLGIVPLGPRIDLTAPHGRAAA